MVVGVADSVTVDGSSVTVRSVGSAGGAEKEELEDVVGTGSSCAGALGVGSATGVLGSVGGVFCGGCPGRLVGGP